MKIWEKIKSKLFGHTFLELIAIGESYSTNIKLQRNFDKSLWAGKIPRPLEARLENFRGRGAPYIRSVDFRDTNQRAVLGFRLAKLAGLQSLEAKVVPLQLIQNFDVKTVGYPVTEDKIFLTEFKGDSLTKYLQSNNFQSFEVSDIEDKDEAIRSFVFNLWIGNYDNKDKDYLVDENKNLISIDYHLLGPGFRDNPKLALGAWGESFDIENTADTGWCIGDGQLLQFVRNSVNRWEPFAATIRIINSISTLRIKWAMRGLNFYNQGTQQNINRLFYNFLLERRPKLEQTIKKWIAAGCPLADLPKENGIQ